VNGELASIHRFSTLALAFRPTLILPYRQQVGASCQATRDAVAIFLSDQLKSNAAELIFEEQDSRTGFNPMFTSQLDRNHNFALGGDVALTSFDLYNKWGSCLSTVTPTGCGFAPERESVKAGIEWVG
jgi:hypothetical protein